MTETDNCERNDDDRLKMSASGCWCALILLTFTQDSLGNCYERFLQPEKSKEYPRHQQNHRSSALVDRKLVPPDPTEFRAAANGSPTEVYPFAENRHVAEIVRSTLARNRAVNNPFRPEAANSAIAIPRPAVDSGNRRADEADRFSMENSRRGVARRSVEITPGEPSETAPRVPFSEKRAARIRTAETRSRQEHRRPADETSPTEMFRPMEILWTEMEQPDASSVVERSQIRHGRSRSHLARQKMDEDPSSSRNACPKDQAVNRINEINAHEDQTDRSTEPRRAKERTDDLPKGFVSSKRNHSWLLGRNFSKDNLATGQSSDRVEDGVPEGLESSVRLSRSKKGSVPEGGSSAADSFDPPPARPIERNSSKKVNPGRSSDRIEADLAEGAEGDANVRVSLKAYHSGPNHGVLRSSPGTLKVTLKDDPLTKLRKAMSLNKTIVQQRPIDGNTTTDVAVGIDQAEEDVRDLEEEEVPQDLDYTSYEEPTANVSSADRSAGGRRRPQAAQVDIVTRFLRIIENQHTLGENCTAGTDLNLGEGVVDQYAQERFRLEANLAVNRANMLTRLWKYAPGVMLASEYLLHASVLSMVEFDEDIFAAGNCYDKLQYRGRWLYCPFAHRLPNQDGILVKDLAIQYKYLSNSSEWFYIARKNAERVIASYEQFSRGKHLSPRYLGLAPWSRALVVALSPPISAAHPPNPEGEILPRKGGARRLVDIISVSSMTDF